MSDEQRPIEEVIGEDNALILEEIRQGLIGEWYPILNSLDKIFAQMRENDPECDLAIGTEIVGEVITEEAIAKYTLVLEVTRND